MFALYNHRDVVYIQLCLLQYMILRGFAVQVHPSTTEQIEGPERRDHFSRTPQSTENIEIRQPRDVRSASIQPDGKLSHELKNAEGILRREHDARQRVRKSGNLHESPDPWWKAPIPKNIHFMYKVDLRNMTDWPNPVWKMSFQGWKTFFPEGRYRYFFWDDVSMTHLFSKHCSKHLDLYWSFKLNISRSDLARYCILYVWGGIYSDLDYEPRTDFSDWLKPGQVSLIESPYRKEYFQNSLMASPKGHPYWKDILQNAEARRQIENPTAATGPLLLDNSSYVRIGNGNELLRPDIHYLPCQYFQRRTHGSLLDHGKLDVKPFCGNLDEHNVWKMKGIHWGTWTWTHQMGKGTVNCKDIAPLFAALHGAELLSHPGWGFDTPKIVPSKIDSIVAGTLPP
eukprot:gnl/MRDRNA2_/MRDRNA2_96339_c0_seq1.p1 gnl/MRDRNA2_/MRDRNA2_96339_c0~~gnl/MRDRNA2_/MRDRNA2_96339_c0_seq1.p1  ORF type:complete len:398 (+),score=36.13 gnl/MRDRNA2_/MRDRNA2_96339_c0_seq1:109-1302(+)